MLNFWKPRRLPQRASSRRAPASRPEAKFEVLESRQMLTTYSGDFNADGISDLAIGVPGLKFGTATNAGGVSVIYGKSQAGLATPNNQIWTMSRPGMIGGTQKDDAMGSAIAIGDFNGDGFSDLAIGLPGRDVIVPYGTLYSIPAGPLNNRYGIMKGVGAVTVLYGSLNGLLSNGNQFFTETSIFPLSTLYPNTNLGASLTTGDFDGDGFADLAIGVPNATVGSVLKAGSAYVLYGSSTGLTTSGVQLIAQGAGGVLGAANANSGFSHAMTTGDFNSDGFSDLAIGAPNYLNSGSVNVLYGDSTGLPSAGNQFWQEGKGQLKGNASLSSRNQFGWALTTGDFNGDLVTDLAIGAPSDGTGSVTIIFGYDLNYDGLYYLNNQFITRSSLRQTASIGDKFGYSLAAGRFNGDQFDDLAVGTPLADVGGLKDAGLVQIIYGSATGLTAVDTYSITQAGGAKGYNFGSEIVTGDYNADGYIDIAIAAPHQNFGSILNVGAVEVNYGSPTGIGKKNCQLWRFGLLGLQGTAAVDTVFGTAMG